MKTILNFFVKKLSILSKESFIFKKPCEIPQEKLQNVSNVQKYYGILFVTDMESWYFDNKTYFQT
ncbi:MAG: hypothetical protein HDT10_03740 [Helicobacter sp.]|nr:hypothetical protein [Helicobacter sp.]